jgi:membrane protease YdiL (CAAX protease family)
MTDEIKYSILRVIPFLIVLLAIRFAVRRKRLSTEDICIQAPVSYQKLIIWLGLYLLFIILTELILYKVSLLEVAHWHYSLSSSIIRIFGIVILAPTAEELLFRGIFLYKLMQWKLNKHLAVLIQALFFVLLHSFTYKNTLSSNIGIAQVFIDASLFAYARLSTQSIFAPILMHATGNLIAVLEQFIL